jgi:hypothetical protein
MRFCAGRGRRAATVSALSGTIPINPLMQFVRIQAAFLRVDIKVLP